MCSALSAIFCEMPLLLYAGKVGIYGVTARFIASCTHNPKLAHAYQQGNSTILTLYACLCPQYGRACARTFIFAEVSDDGPAIEWLAFRERQLCCMR